MSAPERLGIVKCVVCDGAGLLNRPPWIAGDQPTWSATNTSPHKCKACEGKGWLVVDR